MATSRCNVSVEFYFAFLYLHSSIDISRFLHACCYNNAVKMISLYLLKHFQISAALLFENSP